MIWAALTVAKLTRVNLENYIQLLDKVTMKPDKDMAAENQIF